MAEYWVYILHCENDTYYTGYTTNIERRYLSHRNNSGKCKYTRSFKPIRLAQCWRVESGKSLALKIESFIKKLSRSEKLALILEPRTLSQIFSSTPVNIEELNSKLTEK